MRKCRMHDPKAMEEMLIGLRNTSMGAHKISYYYQSGPCEIVFFNDRKCKYLYSHNYGRIRMLSPTRKSNGHDEEECSKFGIRLSEMIKASDYSYNDIVSHSGISDSMFKYYTRGIKYPSDERLEALAYAVGCEVEDLI